MTPSELREIVFERDRGCVWPSDHDGPLELVHLHHRGMGGRPSMNTEENCVCMCRLHHAIFDGRTVGVSARAEWKRLFQHLAGIGV